MSLSWSSVFSVGIPSLDDDHRKLMGMIERVEAAIIAGMDVSELMAVYSEEMKRHAERELAVLHRYGYDKHDEMLEAHEKLSEQFSVFERAVSENSATDKLTALWLKYQHMWIGVLVTHSMEYKYFFEARGITPFVEDRQHTREAQQRAAAYARAVGGSCGWDKKSATLPTDELAEILMCAANHGCRACVWCSETALAHFIESVCATTATRPILKA
jgi:hemerythrin